MEKTIRHFAFSEGLFGASRIVANLSTNASIALLPFFGLSGVFVATSIQMTIQGLLEVPTGMLADRYGWSRSVLLGLVINYFSTFTFLGVVISASLDQAFWVWTFVACEAVIDATAMPFISGAYQAAYLDWYRDKLRVAEIKTEDSPPLFLASFSYGLWVRFGLPTALIIVLVILTFLAKRFQFFNPYVVAYTSIGFIAALRLAVIVRTTYDLWDQLCAAATPHIEKIQTNYRTLGSEIKRSVPALLSYSCAEFIGITAAFYFAARIFQVCALAGLPTSFAWISGLCLGLLVYLLKTLFSFLVFPKVQKLKTADGIALLSAGLAVFALILGSVLLAGSTPMVELVSLLLFSVTSSVVAEAIQRFTESSLDHLVLAAYRATWLSVANAIAYVAFALSAGSIWYFNLAERAPGIFCIVFLFLTLSMAGSFYRLARPATRPLNSLHSRKHFAHRLPHLKFRDTTD